MSSVNALRSGWMEGEGSDDQSTYVSPPSTPMPLASLVTSVTHRASWFTPQSTSLPSSSKPRPLTSSDFRIRRASTQSSSRGGEKVKDPSKAKDFVDSSDGASVSGYEADSYTTTSHNAASSFTSKESSSRVPSASRSLSPLSRKRGSLLATASDALGFRFGRRRKSIRQQPLSIMLPDVIEITASRRDDEVEERERLRDAAAQSIGLDPILMSTEDTVMEVDENEHENQASFEGHQDLTRSERALDSIPTDGRFPNDYRVSDSIMQSHGGSLRKNSSQSYKPSSLTTTIPDFPSTVINLTEFTQNSSSLTKHYPTTSLRLFTLSRNWKSRFLVLSSAPSLPPQGPTVSYLHLFRSSAAEEKELERLEINEESVVFVAEEDVAGRRNVVKVGGVDVGAMKGSSAAGVKMMWFLQIVDPSEAQKWITLIKNIILGQRSMRAGLGIPLNTQGGIEPRGDMDVMLSMRAQGIVTSLTVKQSGFNSSRSLPTIAPHPLAASGSYAASISSQSSRSHAPSPKPQTLAVSTLKGLFSAVTRPRSPSQSASVDDGSERETNEDSFGHMGHNLLSLVRASDAPPRSPRMAPIPSPIRLYHASPTTEFSTTSQVSEQRLDRRIATDHQSASLPAIDPLVKASRTLSMGSLSLQPAPRKRPWTIRASSPPEQFTTNSEKNANITAMSCTVDEEPTSSGPPDFSGFSFGTPEQKARAPSLHSVSTFASGEMGSMERSTSSTKTKRWSRQGSLPKRLTPPSGPPPAVPPEQSSRVPNNHPYLSEGGTSCQSSSSIRSAASQISVVSGLPNFSKRASNSSGLSTNSSSASHPNGHSINRPVPSHRVSVPPPRPAPTFALPPAPDHDGSSRPAESAPATRNSFRDSLPHRSFRLSLNAPKPPPSTTLPPLPDEPEYQNKVSANSSNTPSADLYPIPASPIPAVSPLPPPTYPLPPTPSSTPVLRNSSIKQRLRILSAPSVSPVPSVPEESGASTSPRHPVTRMYRRPPHMYTPPTTPIGERITHLQNDPSFLQLQSPISPTFSDEKAVRRLPSPPVNLTFPELTSLSPPPRRGSRQLPLLDKEVEDHPNSLEVKTPTGDEKLISLSRHGSVISLGIVSM